MAFGVIPMKVAYKKYFYFVLCVYDVAITVNLAYHLLRSKRINNTRASKKNAPVNCRCLSSFSVLYSTWVVLTVTVSGAHSPCITTVSPGKRRICMRSRSFITVRVSRSRRVSVTSTRCVIMTVSRCVVTSLCTLQLDITHALTNKNSA